MNVLLIGVLEGHPVAIGRTLSPISLSIISSHLLIFRFCTSLNLKDNFGRGFDSEAHYNSGSLVSTSAGWSIVALCKSNEGCS